MNLPPDSFYYVLSAVFGAALIWIIKIYIGRQDKILTELSKTVHSLNVMVAVHEEKHEDTDRRLGIIEGNGNGHGHGKGKGGGKKS